MTLPYATRIMPIETPVPSPLRDLLRAFNCAGEGNIENMFPSPAQLNARNKSRNGEGLGPRLGFSLLPRNNLRMTFDPPERKAEGEPGSIFARDRRHMTSRATSTRIYVRVTRFSRESSIEARNRNAGYAIGSRIAEWQEGKKSAEDARSRRVERTSSIHL